MVLAALAAAGSFFDPGGMTARMSMLPEAAGRANWTLDHTNSMYEAVFNLAYIAGPGVGGLLIATIGGVNTMWITAAAFGLSILTMAVLRLPGTGRPDRSEQPEGVMSGVIEGLKFVWHNKVLRTLGLIDLSVTALYLPMESVLFPKYFTDRNEPAQLGWVLMALSIGGLVGALSWSMLSRIASRRATVLTAVLTFGVASLIISVLPPLPIILVLCALVGLVYGPIGPIYNSVMQTRTPENMRGRVVGVMTSMTYAAGPVGFMLAGPMIDAFGLRATFLVLAVPILLIGVITSALPSLRELDGAPVSPGSGHVRVRDPRPGGQADRRARGDRPRHHGVLPPARGRQSGRPGTVSPLSVSESAGPRRAIARTFQFRRLPSASHCTVISTRRNRVVSVFASVIHSR